MRRAGSPSSTIRQTLIPAGVARKRVERRLGLRQPVFRQVRQGAQGRHLPGPTVDRGQARQHVHHRQLGTETAPQRFRLARRTPAPFRKFHRQQGISLRNRRIHDCPTSCQEPRLSPDIVRQTRTKNPQICRAARAGLKSTGSCASWCLPGPCSWPRPCFAHVPARSETAFTFNELDVELLEECEALDRQPKAARWSITMARRKSTWRSWRRRSCRKPRWSVSPGSSASCAISHGECLRPGQPVELLSEHWPGGACGER